MKLTFCAVIIALAALVMFFVQKEDSSPQAAEMESAIEKKSVVVKPSSVRDRPIEKRIYEEDLTNSDISHLSPQLEHEDLGEHALDEEEGPPNLRVIALSGELDKITQDLSLQGKEALKEAVRDPESEYSKRHRELLAEIRKDN